jgi:hypothetical protein
MWHWLAGCPTVARSNGAVHHLFYRCFITAVVVCGTPPLVVRTVRLWSSLTTKSDDNDDDNLCWTSCLACVYDPGWQVPAFLRLKLLHHPCLTVVGLMCSVAMCPYARQCGSRWVQQR